MAWHKFRLKNIFSQDYPTPKILKNKKVLRERKRYTARHVASARYAGGGGGYPI